METLTRTIDTPKAKFVRAEDGSLHLKHEACPLCGMSMIAGKSVSRHHLVPQLKGGGPFSKMHEVCHGKIHSLWSEGELRDIFNAAGNAEGYWKAISTDDRIQKFRKFGRKQFARDPEYVDSNKLSNTHKNRRRR